MASTLPPQPGIAQLAQTAREVLRRMQSMASASRDTEPDTERMYGLTEIAELTGRSIPTLARYAEDGRIPAPIRRPGRRPGYDPAGLAAIHQALGSGLRRPDTSPPTILGIANFKGGSGKSTLTVHLAHALAIRGARVLVIDCDPQATTSQMFGRNPIGGIAREDTLYPFLSIIQTQTSLAYAIRPTRWPTIHLIASCLDLSEAEYELAASASGQAVLAIRIQELRRAITEAGQAYDVVLLDPPPALGMIALAVMQSASALIIPTNATLHDFASTVQYLDALLRTEATLAREGLHLTYDFIRILPARLDPNAQSQQTALSFMRHAFGAILLAHPFLASAEVANAALRFRSVLELEGPMGSTRTYRRCIENVTALCGEIADLIRASWNITAHEPNRHAA